MEINPRIVGIVGLTLLGVMSATQHATGDSVTVDQLNAYITDILGCDMGLDSCIQVLDVVDRLCTYELLDACLDGRWSEYYSIK